MAWCQAKGARWGSSMRTPLQIPARTAAQTPQSVFFKWIRYLKGKQSLPAPSQPCPKTQALYCTALLRTLMAHTDNPREDGHEVFYSYVQGAETFWEDLWPSWPPQEWFPLPLVWTWGWVRLGALTELLLSESGLFKWLQGVLSCLDWSQRKCWCKSCKPNLPPPWATCSLFVFYFISCDIPNPSVWQATRQHGGISGSLSANWTELSSPGSLSPHPYIFKGWITKLRNQVSFETKNAQSSHKTTPYMTLKLIPEG